RSHSYADFFAGTEAFLMKNARAELCLQASPMDGNVLLENCNPDSDFQDWSWQGHSLMNRGTRRCLSMVGDDTLKTSFCGSTSWDCSDSLLSPLGSSQGYLVANRKGVTLSNFKALNAKWQDVANRSVCEEKAEQDLYILAALTSTQEYEHPAANMTLELGLSQEELENLLWFFRREDPSTWNYSTLALSFASLILGLLLLAINVTRNRKRKIHVYQEATVRAQQGEEDAKKALMPVPQEYSPSEPGNQDPQDQKAGEVVVQWKDGTVTSLYTERPEDPM
ncbi:OSTB protein, partial [Alcedo cyanopectus]|nr:OSTB protein [Ceyx cyanopectus]